MKTPQVAFYVALRSDLGDAELRDKYVVFPTSHQTKPNSQGTPSMDSLYFFSDALFATWLTMLNMALLPKFSSQRGLGTSIVVTKHRRRLYFGYRGFTAGLLEATVAFIDALQAPLNEGTFVAAKEVVRNMNFHKASNSFALAWYVN